MSAIPSQPPARPFHLGQRVELSATGWANTAPASDVPNALYVSRYLDGGLVYLVDHRERWAGNYRVTSLQLYRGNQDEMPQMRIAQPPSSVDTRRAAGVNPGVQVVPVPRLREGVEGVGDDPAGVPAAVVDPAPNRPPLPAGARVRRSPLAARRGVHAHHPDRQGTVARPCGGIAVYVLWDGNRSTDRIHRDFVEVVPVVGPVVVPATIPPDAPARGVRDDVPVLTAAERGLLRRAE